MPQRMVIGTVKTDRMAKTRRVEIPRPVRHPLYGKIMKKRTVCYVHDENNESHVGDRVEIQEVPPISRLKRWTLVRIVEKNRMVGVAGLSADDVAGKKNS